ncbi:beta-lactamase family protein [Flavobacteriaceae bacterium F89]|uniref:Beta-lactamase family protein n=1 Tax=Cerina litoralis TaxID=2874477 RepID=A0AAE3ERK0_9FLAO|nr:serine hydrolase domain-containing protein [Cerina litoralis]MCG2459927.1 beta-lactamase family protein [Cerina litoralis]
MQRFKILVGSTLLILTVFLLTLSASKPNTTSPSNTKITTSRSQTASVDLIKLQQYRSRQQELRAALKEYFKNTILSGNLVGAGVSIVKGDSIVISEGFGKRNTNLNGKVDGETVFRLGSLSKGFAGVLAAEVENEGELDWSSKVVDYIPEFQLGNKENTSKITLADILSQTSGTPYHSYTNLIEAGLSLTDIAERFKDVTPISEPGSMYSYQNAMFALSGEMMRRATGKNIKTLLKNRLLNPLGMCSTSMDYETLLHTSNIAMPHVKWRSGWKERPLKDDYFNAVAAGGVSSSAHDMAKWMRFLLGHDPEVMNKSALQDVFNPFVEVGGHSKYYQRWPGHIKSYYGFGWRIHKFMEDDAINKKTIWHHGGSVNDYRNEIAIFPESDLGICVLMNCHSKIASTVIPDLYKIVKEIYGQSAPQIVLNSGAKMDISL